MAPPKNVDLKNVVKEALKELLCDDDFLNKFLSKVNEKISELQKIVDKQTTQINQLEGRIEAMQQQTKINNICVYNLEEEENEKLATKLINIFTRKMNIPLKRQDIVKCYRIGENKEKPRPVIIKFEQFHTKVFVLKNAYKLKGTKIGLAEDLNKERLNLYRQVTQKYDRKDIFTRFGNIYIKTKDNAIKKIFKINDV